MSAYQATSIKSYYLSFFVFYFVLIVDFYFFLNLSKSRRRIKICFDFFADEKRCDLSRSRRITKNCFEFDWWFISNFSLNSYNCVKQINYVIRRIQNRNQVNVLNIESFRWCCIFKFVFWLTSLFRKSEIKKYRHSFQQRLNWYDENDDKNLRFSIQIQVESRIWQNEHVKQMKASIRKSDDRYNV